jgi:hypothetical protein
LQVHHSHRSTISADDPELASVVEFTLLAALEATTVITSPDVTSTQNEPVVPDSLWPD